MELTAWFRCGVRRAYFVAWGPCGVPHAGDARLSKAFYDRFGDDIGMAATEVRLDKRITEVEATLGARITASHSAMSLAMQREFKDQNRMHYLAWAIQIAAIVGLYAR